MRNINEALLLGNVGADPEIRSGDFGRAATFSLATSKKWTAEGETKERTQWHRVKAFNPSRGGSGQALADLVDRYVKKGARLLVRGEIVYREWTMDDVKHYSTEIIAREIVLLDHAESAT